MGGGFSRSEEPEFYSSSSTDSSDCDSDTDDMFSSEEPLQENDHPNINLDMDAINPSSGSNGGLPFRNLKISSIKTIENELDEYERISLIFLLCDNCLDEISLQDFFMRNNVYNWQEKLIEALAIIKNFQIPKKFGFSKEALMKEYFPFKYFTTKYISKIRKVLYIVCEQLNDNEIITFLREIRKDLNKKNYEFVEYPYLEMYFSYFFKIGYISENNLSNLSQIFKIMDLEEICDMFKVFQGEDKQLENPKKILQCNMTRSVSADEACTNTGIYSSSNVSLVSNYSNSTQDNAQPSKNVSENTGYIYDTSKDRICLIINQENFYTEIDEEYKHLLPENIEQEKLHTRHGTSFDSERLESTLKRRRFRVKTRKNMPHLDMINELEKTLSEIDEKNCSCLFVIILSHGDDGVVYAANSCYVEISTLIEIMCKRKLKNIPKVLIIQSCQGSTLQTVSRLQEDIDTDGPSLKHNTDSKSPHFLLFSSTVSGFGSIRNKQTGSWFIQSLCNQLDKAGDQEHFEEICLNIKNEVTKKRWKKDKDTECYMVPITKSTLAGKLFLKI